jgi:hypothetical protein
VGRLASTCRASIGLGQFFPINWLDQPIVLSRDGVEGVSADRGRQLGDNARYIVELAILKAAIGCTPPFAEADALNKVDQAFKQDHGDMAIWDLLGVHPL